MKLRHLSFLTSRFLLYVLFVVFPFNLGKHFEITDSYVWGILSDYLVPTIYLQDIVIFLIIMFWLFGKGPPSLDQLNKVFLKSTNTYLAMFVFSAGFSVLASQRITPSLVIYLRLLLYTALFFYFQYAVRGERYFKKHLYVMFFSSFYVSVLGIIQFANQGSVFNNYLFFGEQPYSFNTWGIAKEFVFGSTIIPAYGLFRHPNVFGGHLSIILVWFLYFLRRSHSKEFLVPVFIVMALALVFTFSYTAWAAFLLGVFFLRYFERFWDSVGHHLVKKLFLVFFTAVFLLNVFSPKFSLLESTSFSRRGGLFITATEVLKNHFLFGVGPGSFVLFVGDFLFTQPVHNIYLLLLSEYGIFSFMFFILLVFSVIKNLVKEASRTENLSNPGVLKDQNYLCTNRLLLVSILQIIFMGSLDHYFLTIHQTQILLWVILGLASGSFTASENTPSVKITR